MFSAMQGIWHRGLLFCQCLPDGAMFALHVGSAFSHSSQFWGIVLSAGYSLSSVSLSVRNHASIAS